MPDWSLILGSNPAFPISSYLTGLLLRTVMSAYSERQKRRSESLGPDATGRLSLSMISPSNCIQHALFATFGPEAADYRLDNDNFRGRLHARSLDSWR